MQTGDRTSLRLLDTYCFSNLPEGGFPILVKRPDSIFLLPTYKADASMLQSEGGDAAKAAHVETLSQNPFSANAIGCCIRGNATWG